MICTQYEELLTSLAVGLSNSDKSDLFQFSLSIHFFPKYETKLQNRLHCILPGEERVNTWCENFLRNASAMMEAGSSIFTVLLVGRSGVPPGDLTPSTLRSLTFNTWLTSGGAGVE